MKINVTKINNSLFPCFDADFEAFKKIPNNEMVIIEYKKTRNVQFHRKFFSLINLAFQNQELTDDIEFLRKAILIECGISELKTNPFNGEQIAEAKSLNFSKMDNNEFEQVYNKVLNFICEWLGTTNEDIINELMYY